MNQFRKKPVVIHAIQWDGRRETFKSLQEAGMAAVYSPGDQVVAPELVIKTLEGEMRAVHGDWIIKGVKGEFYPCKPDIFAATYDKAAGGDKTLHNTDVSGARKNVPDLEVFGDGDAFKLICKASSRKEGWMKSTKAMNVGTGAVVQVTTQQKNPDGSYAVAEALCFVPDALVAEKWVGDQVVERRLAPGNLSNTGLANELGPAWKRTGS